MTTIFEEAEFWMESIHIDAYDTYLDRMIERHGEALGIDHDAAYEDEAHFVHLISAEIRAGLIPRLHEETTFTFVTHLGDRMWEGRFVSTLATIYDTKLDPDHDGWHISDDHDGFDVYPSLDAVRKAIDTVIATEAGAS